MKDEKMRRTFSLNFVALGKSEERSKEIVVINVGHEGYDVRSGNVLYGNK